MARRPKTRWLIYWSIWLFGGFLIPEIIAITNREPGDTFSESVWWLRDLGSFFAALIAMVTLWLFYHFTIEKKGNPMFQNLSFTNFTWRREPILYLALFVAIGNVVLDIIAGDLNALSGIESIVALVVGFFGRGQVTPVEQ